MAGSASASGGKLVCIRILLEAAGHEYSGGIESPAHTLLQCHDTGLTRMKGVNVRTHLRRRFDEPGLPAKSRGLVPHFHVLLFERDPDPAPAPVHRPVHARRLQG